MSTHTSEMPDRITHLVGMIFPAPEYDEIVLTDPRFRWVLKRLYTGRQDITTLRDLVDTSVGDMSIDNAQLEESLTHLRDFMQEQVDACLEDELFAIVAPLIKSADRVPAMLDRFGWAGKPQTTLQEAADAFSVTRERVRQIQARIERQLLRHQVWTPVLDRAVKIVRSELPLSERDMGIRLKSAGIAKTSTFSAEGLVKAIELFEPDVKVEVVTRHGSAWLIDPTADDQSLVISDVRAAIQKGVSNQGVMLLADVRSVVENDAPGTLADYSDARLRGLVEDLDGYQVVEESWVLHHDASVRNPLVNRLQKILSVCLAISVEWAVHQLRREHREHRRLVLSAETLEVFVRHRPEFRLHDGKISAVDPENPRDVLSECEYTLRERMVESGGSASFSELEAAGYVAGFQKITVAVSLKSSPIFYKPAYNTYRVIGGMSGTEMPDTPEVSDSDARDDTDAAIAEADLPESNLVFEESDQSEVEVAPAAREKPSAPSPPRTATGEQVDDREAGRVRKLIKQLLKREGLVSVDTIVEQYAQRYRPVSRDVILAVASATEDFVVINDQLVTSLPRNGTNPLGAGLRKMLTWLPALPPEVAVRQFLRDSKTVTQLTEEMLLEDIGMDDEFALRDGVIVWERPDLVSNVLSSEEKVIAQLLRDLPEPIGLGTVHSRLDLPRHMEPEFDELFLNCVLVEEVGKNRYRLFGAEYRSAIEQSEVDEAAVSSTMEAESDSAAVSAVTAAREHEATGDAVEPAKAANEDDKHDPEGLIDEAPGPADTTSTTLLPSSYGSTETTMLTLNDLVSRARDGRLRLPEIQRDYVWKSTQVRSLLDSLYRHYPIGNMLVWETSDSPVSRQLGGSNGSTSNPGETVSFLLDGQQRLTSLQRLIDHNEPDIRFNLFTEEFRAATATVKRNLQWIPVHSVLTRSVGAALRDHGLDRHPEVEELERRLERLKGILSIPIPVNRLHNFDYEGVTDIFVRVNSQGTRLRTAELAVANLAFQLPGIVSRQLAGLRDELAADGWDIDTMVLLRMLNGIVTGQSSFSRLAKVHTSEIEAGWPKLVDGVHRALRVIREHLGIESVDWLPTINALVVPVTYMAYTDEDKAHVQALIDWFVRASTFGRYTGPTETRMNQDLRALLNAASPFRIMITALRSSVGNFRITLADLQGATWQSPLSLLFWLTLRRARAVDLWTGMPLNATRFDGGHDIVQHQLFPRRAPGVSLLSSQANELSNFALLAQEPDIMLQNTVPAQALTDVPVDRLERQYIPTDPDLWQPANAKRFVEHRRRLLVRAMNETLQSLAESPSDDDRYEKHD